MGRFKSAYLTLGILAPPPVRQAAGERVTTMWKLGDAAISGDLDDFERAGLATKGPRDAVRAAMRDDLGVPQ